MKLTQVDLVTPFRVKGLLTSQFVASESLAIDFVPAEECVELRVPDSSGAFVLEYLVPRDNVACMRPLKEAKPVAPLKPTKK